MGAYNIVDLLKEGFVMVSRKVCHLSGNFLNRPIGEMMARRLDALDFNPRFTLDQRETDIEGVDEAFQLNPNLSATMVDELFQERIARPQLTKRESSHMGHFAA